MRILAMKCSTGQEYLSVLDPTSHALFYRTKTSLEAQEVVLVEVSFPELPHRELLRARVARPDIAGSGYWLEVLSDDDRARQHVEKFARGEIALQEAAPRRHARFPVEVPVDWRETRSDERFVSRIEDLGAGGAFVRTHSPPPPGAEVALVIWNGEDSMAIPGEVAWVRESGGQEGMGIRFLRATAGDARRLREMLRRMEERGRVDLGGDAEEESPAEDTGRAGGGQ